jgi:hypothetical protein
VVEAIRSTTTTLSRLLRKYNSTSKLLHRPP